MEHPAPGSVLLSLAPLAPREPGVTPSEAVRGDPAAHRAGVVVVVHRWSGAWSKGTLIVVRGDPHGTPDATGTPVQDPPPFG